MSNKETSVTTIHIDNYSQWNLIIYGSETKTHKEVLLGLDCKYNPHLKNPANPEEKIPGWIYPIKHKGRLIDALIMNDIEYINNTNK